MDILWIVISMAFAVTVGGIVGAYWGVSSVSEPNDGIIELGNIDPGSDVYYREPGA